MLQFSIMILQWKPVIMNTKDNKKQYRDMVKTMTITFL